MESSDTDTSAVVYDSSLEGFLSEHFGTSYMQDAMIAVGIFVVCYVALWIFRRYVLNLLDKYAKQTTMQLDDVVIARLRDISFAFFITASLFCATIHMEMPDLVRIVIKGSFLIMLVLECVKLGERVLVNMLMMSFSKSSEDRAASTAISVMVRIILWCVGLLLVLSNLGFNVNSLLAGLGVGGLAVSLALQQVLQDIFSSISIIVDKPFEEGDFITIGTDMGTVEKIGLKSTRIRTLQGEELVVSNRELTETRVQNFKKLQKRRILNTVGVIYDTPSEKLKKIPQIIKDIIDAVEDVDFDRAHFKEFGDFSLNIEFVFYVDSSEYIDYMNVQQEINLRIHDAFAVEGIEMAFPTQTVYLEKNA